MRIAFWALVIELNHDEIRVMPNDNAIPNINTGSPVPTAKTAGRAIPPVDLRASGIKIPKYNTAL